MRAEKRRDDAREANDCGSARAARDGVSPGSRRVSAERAAPRDRALVRALRPGLHHGDPRPPRRVFSDPDVIARALRERPAVYRRIGLIEDVFEEMGINGVFSAEGEAWRAQRRTVAAALDAKHVRAFFPTLARVTRRLERRWLAAAARDEPTDVLREAMLYTVDVTTNLAFGYDMNTLEEPAAPIQHDLERLFPMINRRIALPYPYWRHVRLPADRALDRSLVALRARIDGMVAETRERVASSGTAGPRERNFLESAVTQAPGAPELSSRDIFANVVNLLLGGEDTTASTLAWALHYIGERPAVAARLAAEADDVLGAADVVPRIEDVARLRYHDAVVMETLRLRPVAPVLALEANVATELGGVALPPGTVVSLLLRPSALDERRFPRAHAFEPERWLADAPPPETFAFGAGPRLCPGRNLALVELAVALSMISKNFEVGPGGDRRKVTENYALTMFPKNLRLRLRARAPGL